MKSSVVLMLFVSGILASMAFATRTHCPAVDPPSTGILFRSIQSEGHELKYAVYVPRDYDPAKPLPAIVFLHGAGECGTDGQKHIAQGIGMNILWNAARWPCIVVMPQKPVQRDQWEKYDALVMAALERTKSEFSIDPARISLTGLSQGGHGTWALAALHPETWCAIAPICGYADIHGGGLTPDDIAAKIKSIPVWCFHGEDDDIVPASQSRAVIDALKQAGGVGPGGAEPKLTLYPKIKHDSWTKAYAEAELPAFLMAPRKK